MAAFPSVIPAVVGPDLLGGHNKEKFKRCELHLWIYLLQLRSLGKNRPQKLHTIKQFTKGYPLGSEYMQKKE